MVCPNVNCKYRTYDDLCRELKIHCRIYIRYKAQHNLDKEYENEQIRNHELNDCHLADILTR